MHDSIVVLVNGVPVRVAQGSSVAVALLVAGVPARRSVNGSPRSPLCGMGVCMECRAEVDSVMHSRTCQIVCQPNMRVRTQ
jgi:D-hydroxyproline dehydrogenase subunit gamma